MVQCKKSEIPPRISKIINSWANSSGVCLSERKRNGNKERRRLENAHIMVSATGFWWGKQEHRFERWTNYLLVATIILFYYSLYHDYLKKYAFYALLITFVVHLTARICHRIEKYYHNK